VVRRGEEITAAHRRLLVVYREFNRYALRQLQVSDGLNVEQAKRMNKQTST